MEWCDPEGVVEDFIEGNYLIRNWWGRFNRNNQWNLFVYHSK